MRIRTRYQLETLEFIMFIVSKEGDGDISLWVKMDNSKDMLLRAFIPNALRFKSDFRMVSKVDLFQAYDKLNSEQQKALQLALSEHIKDEFKIAFNDFDNVVSYGKEISESIDRLASCTIDTDPEKIAKDLVWLMDKKELSFPIYTQKNYPYNTEKRQEINCFKSPFELQGLKQVSTKVTLQTFYFSETSSYVLESFIEFLRRENAHIISEQEFNEMYEKQFEMVSVGMESINWRLAYEKNEQHIAQLY